MHYMINTVDCVTGESTQVSTKIVIFVERKRKAEVFIEQSCRD